MGFVDLGKYGWATRDCPNVIIPPRADPRLLTATYIIDNWGGWPANYGQIIAATAAEYLVTHAYLNMGLGVSVNVNGTTYFGNHMHLRIGKGAAGSESVIAELMSASADVFQVSGIVDDSVNVLLFEENCRTVPLAPTIVPAGSRLAVGGQVSGAPTQKRGGIYLGGWGTASLSYAQLPAFDELFMRGGRPCYSDVQVITAPVTVLANGVAWALGTWVQVGAALDDDYLYDQATALGTVYPFGAAQFDIGLGPDVDHVVIQARYAIASGYFLNAADNELLLPFIAYKGEKAWVRVAAERADVNTAYSVTLHSKRFS